MSGGGSRLNPVAHAADTAGVAATVGEDGIASAGLGGHLVFVDTNAVGGPVVRVFAVGEHGIEPNVPYYWLLARGHDSTEEN